MSVNFCENTITNNISINKYDILLCLAWSIFLKDFFMKLGRVKYNRVSYFLSYHSYISILMIYHFLFSYFESYIVINISINVIQISYCVYKYFPGNTSSLINHTKKLFYGVRERERERDWETIGYKLTYQ